MPQTRRAAAANQSRLPAPTTTTPPRRKRRASFRSSHQGQRDLFRRRADFDRIASHYVTVLKDFPSTYPVSSATNSGVGASEPSQEDLSLTGEWALSIADEPDERLSSLLRALLRKLQSISNLTEANEEHENQDKALFFPDKDENVHSMADVLATERFISHDEDHIRLFTSCCLAELLRICAPDPPMSQRKLNQVCALFIEQLAVLSSPNDPMEAFRFPLLEQLATVKTFVIFCDDRDIVCDIFACFYAVCRSHQPEKVHQYFADILISLVDEMENFDTEALDAMLAPLVPILRYSKSAVALAEAVLCGSSTVIQVPLCNVLNASIRGLRRTQGLDTPDNPEHSRRKSPARRPRQDKSALEDTTMTEHHLHISDLIVAINRVAPDILIYVIPNLESPLRSSDDAVRLASVHLLACLFTSRGDVVDSYPSLFAEFLTRQRDVNTEIRAEVCSVLGNLIVSHPKHAQSLDQMLQDRAIDRDENVRLSAVRTIGKCVDHASEDLLKLLATRVRDKRIAVRREALGQLSEVYRAAERFSMSSKENIEDGMKDESGYDSLDLNRSNSEESEKSRSRKGIVVEEHDPMEVRMHRLCWLPNTLLQSYSALKGAADHVTARMIESIIFDIIPRLSDDDEEKNKSGFRRFAIFLSQLSESALSQLTSLFCDRWNLRRKLLALAQHRLSKRITTPTPSGKDGNGEPFTTMKTFSRRTETEAQKISRNLKHSNVEEARNLAKSLGVAIDGTSNMSDDVQALCSMLATAVDLKIYDKIVKALDCSSSHSECKEAYQDVISRLGSKSRIALFVQEHLFPRCFPGLLSSLYFTTACHATVEQCRVVRSSEFDLDHEQDHMFSNRIFPGMLRFLNIASKHVNETVSANIETVRLLINIKLEGANSSADVILSGLKMICHLPGECREHVSSDELQKKLESLMFEKRFMRIDRGAVLAKWAARVSIFLAGSHSGKSLALATLAKRLATELDSFTGDVEEIIAPISALAQLAKHSPESCKGVALESFDFTKALLSGSFNTKISGFFEEDTFQDSKSPGRKRRKPRNTCAYPMFGVGTETLSSLVTDLRMLCLTEVVQRSIKLLIYSLELVDCDELSTVVEVLLKVESAKENDIFKVSREICSDSDDDETYSHSAEQESASAMRAICRLCASRGMLFLSRHPKFFREITPDVVCSTVSLAWDDYPDVRLSFARTISNCVLKKRLPFRWVVFLPLMGSGADRNELSQIRALLSVIFRQRRRLFEKARRERKQSSIQLLPESCIPELIWMLVHLPGIEADQARGYPNSEKCIQILLDSLLEWNEYTAILNEYIECLSIAHDSSEREDFEFGENSKRMMALGRIAGDHFRRKHAGRKWNLVEHSGRISLPKDMFRIIDRKTETSGVMRPSLLDVARQYDKGKLTGSTGVLEKDTKEKEKASGLFSAPEECNLQGGTMSIDCKKDTFGEITAYTEESCGEIEKVGSSKKSGDGKRRRAIERSEKGSQEKAGGAIPNSEMTRQERGQSRSNQEKSANSKSRKSSDQGTIGNRGRASYTAVKSGVVEQDSVIEGDWFSETRRSRRKKRDVGAVSKNERGSLTRAQKRSKQVLASSSAVQTPSKPQLRRSARNKK